MADDNKQGIEWVIDSWWSNPESGGRMAMYVEYEITESRIQHSYLLLQLVTRWIPKECYLTYQSGIALLAIPRIIMLKYFLNCRNYIVWIGQCYIRVNFNTRVQKHFMVKNDWNPFWNIPTSVWVEYLILTTVSNLLEKYKMKKKIITIKNVKV